MIICWDLDGTITETDTAWEPEYWKKRNINPEALFAMRLAKELGHKNIIHTSRLTSESRVQTIQWLEDHEVPYDGIHFDKPFYDFVIDDKNTSIEKLIRLLTK